MPIESAILTNTGSGSVTLSGVSVTPPYDLATSSTCTATTTLNPSDTCQVDLTFYPTGIESYPARRRPSTAPAMACPDYTSHSVD